MLAPLAVGVGMGVVALAVASRFPGQPIQLPKQAEDSSGDEDSGPDDPAPVAAVDTSAPSTLRRRNVKHNPENVEPPTSTPQPVVVPRQPNPYDLDTQQLNRALFNSDDPAVIEKSIASAKRKADRMVRASLCTCL